VKGDRHRGYRSYAYLGDSLVLPPLAPEVDRVPGAAPALSSAEQARAARLLEECLVVSLHDHPVVMPQDPARFVAYRRQGRDVTGFAGLSRSGLDVVFDGMANGEGISGSAHGHKFAEAVADLGMRLADLAHQDWVVPARSVSDIWRARQHGQLAWVATMEGAMPIGNELDRIDVLFGLGVRMMGIAYSDANALGSGLGEFRDGGLTRLGREAVRRMNRLGMAVDIAHCGDRTSLDTIEASEGPVFISHAGARAVWPSRRMKPDAVLRALAAKGGVIGIEAAPHSTLSASHPEHDLDAVMEHFSHCVAVMGIDHVAFGPDTLFGDHVAYHRQFAHLLPRDDRVPAPPAHAASDHVAGMESPAEALRYAISWLVRHGYDDEAIAKVAGGNVMRVLSEVWPN
jgi:membrane dipeptidase